MTATVKETLKSALDQSNLNKLADCLAQIDLGTMLTPKKITLTGLTAAATHDITDVAHGSNPAALIVGTLRATTVGTGAAGARLVTDVGGTPSATLATISDDGKTVTFEGTVTGFVMEYIPRPAVDMNGAFTRS